MDGPAWARKEPTLAAVLLNLDLNSMYFFDSLGMVGIGRSEATRAFSGFLSLGLVSGATAVSSSGSGVSGPTSFSSSGSVVSGATEFSSLGSIVSGATGVSAGVMGLPMSGGSAGGDVRRRYL